MFYVYTHARPGIESVDAIFYVGKGRRDRGRDFAHRTFYHKNIVAKHGRDNIVIQRYPCRDEAHAADLEKLMIASYRAAGVRLANFTDGGEGLSGHKHSAETKAKISAGNMGKKLSAEHRQFLSDYWKARPCLIAGRPHDEETKAKLRAQKLGKPNLAARGRKHTEEAKAKMSASQLARTGGVSGRYRGAPGRSPEEMEAKRIAREARREERRAEESRKAADREQRLVLVSLATGLPKPKRDNASYRPEVRAKQGAASRRRWADPEYHARQSEALKWTEERKAAFSAKNPSHDPEINVKKSAKLKGYVWKRITCPHCSFTGAEPPMKRYHFDNCKKKGK